MDTAVGVSDLTAIGLRKEGNVLFNDALNTFYLRLYGVRHMVKDHSDSKRGNMGYYFRLAARVLLYASSHSQDNTYHDLCYTSRGALAGTRNSSMGPPWRVDPSKTKFDSLQALEQQGTYAVHRYRYPKRENIFSIRHLKICIWRQ